jgi:EmrB/QacA subfamily drug resistance transporter
VVFTLGSALCGLAPSLGALIAFRAVQGVGGAMLLALSPALLTAAFPPERRGQAIGLNAVFVALGVSTGPTLGGLIAEHLSWRWIFYINIPVGTVAVIATLVCLPPQPAEGRRGFDVPGAALLGLGLAALTLSLSLGGENGWRSPLVLGALLVAVVLLVVFVLWERRAPNPVVDFGLFTDRVFTSATVSLVLSFMAIFAVGFMTPFYLEQLRDLSPAAAGALLTPFPLTVAAAAPLSGWLSDRIGTRWLTFAGLSICALALLMIGGLQPDSTRLDVIWRLSLAGLGQGLFQSPNNSALLGAAPREEQGVASGVMATGRVVGQTLSIAMAGAIFGSAGGAQAGRALMSRGPQADQLAHVFLHAFRLTLLSCAAVAALGAVITLLRGRERVPAAKESCLVRLFVMIDGSGPLPRRPG